MLHFLLKIIFVIRNNDKFQQYPFHIFTHFIRPRKPFLKENYSDENALHFLLKGNVFNCKNIDGRPRFAVCRQILGGGKSMLYIDSL